MSFSKTNDLAFTPFINLDNLEMQDRDILIAILIRFTKKYESLFNSTNCNGVTFSSMIECINEYSKMYTSNLLAYTKGLFKKNTIITYEIMKNDTHYSTFKQLISNNITTEHIDDLRTMLFLKINP